MVLAEDSRKAGAGVPLRINGRNGDGKAVFRVDFAYLIGWIGIIGGSIPGTEN